MTLFPGARWRGPVPNQGGAMGRILGLVLHVQEGSEAGTDAWFHNPTSKVSAHFGNPKAGPLDQWVEVGTVAWAEVSGNTNWISIETEGHSGDQLTPSQLENVAQLLAWLHIGYGVPLQISDSTVPGLTGHGLGGAAWGGHYDCPGAPILAQRQAIIDRAGQLLGTPTAGDTVSYTMTPGWQNDYPDVTAALQAHMPPGTVFDVDHASAYAAIRAFVAAERARTIEDKLDTLLARPAAPPVDIPALAAALGPYLAADTSADAVVKLLAAKLAG